jgi:hypothetical protein
MRKFPSVSQSSPVRAVILRACLAARAECKKACREIVDLSALKPQFVDRLRVYPKYDLHTYHPKHGGTRQPKARGSLRRQGKQDD